MDVGRSDGVSETVSFSDFAHILHEWVHEGTQVDAEIAVTTRCSGVLGHAYMEYLHGVSTNTVRKIKRSR